MSTTFSRSIDALTVTVDIVGLDTFESNDAPHSIIHDIPGRADGTPDVTLRPALSSSGEISLLFLEYADAEAAREFFRAPATFATDATDQTWLPARFVPEFRISRVQRNENRQRWAFVVGFRELAP